MDQRPADDDLRIDCRVYTHARRHPIMIGNIQGLRIPPVTPAQLLVGVGSLVLLVLTQPLWAHFGGRRQRPADDLACRSGWRSPPGPCGSRAGRRGGPGSAGSCSSPPRAGASAWASPSARSTCRAATERTWVAEVTWTSEAAGRRHHRAPGLVAHRQDLGRLAGAREPVQVAAHPSQAGRAQPRAHHAVRPARRVDGPVDRGPHRPRRGRRGDDQRHRPRPSTRAGSTRSTPPSTGSRPPSSTGAATTSACSCRRSAPGAAVGHHAGGPRRRR